MFCRMRATICRILICSHIDKMPPDSILGDVLWGGVFLFVGCYFVG